MVVMFVPEADTADGANPTATSVVRKPVVMIPAEERSLPCARRWWPSMGQGLQVRAATKRTAPAAQAVQVGLRFVSGFMPGIMSGRGARDAVNGRIRNWSRGCHGRSSVVLDIRQVGCDTHLMASIRLTRPTLEVIKVLLASTPDDPAWGLKICEEADLGSGTVYPILDRLVVAGWATRQAESGAHPGRPKRYFYELTAAGQLAAHEASQRKPRLFGLPAAGEGGPS
ncbi:PadR family transcriptional regulator [Streptomyces sp. NPDC059002]|uniref:PadR family transcriptional regulator n=1 Tax=Streptomyces sp. NPDC059002 TaxID=3346690 RepID=UPI0036BAC6BF